MITRTAHYASRCAVQVVALTGRRRRQYLPWLLSFGIIGFGLVLAFFWSYALAQRDSASAWAISCLASIFTAVFSSALKSVVKVRTSTSVPHISHISHLSHIYHISQTSRRPHD